MINNIIKVAAKLDCLLTRINWRKSFISIFGLSQEDKYATVCTQITAENKRADSLQFSFHSMRNVTLAAIMQRIIAAVHRRHYRKSRISPAEYLLASHWNGQRLISAENKWGDMTREASWNDSME